MHIRWSPASDDTIAQPEPDRGTVIPHDTTRPDTKEQPPLYRDEPGNYVGTSSPRALNDMKQAILTLLGR